MAAYAAGPLQPAWTSVSNGLIAVVPAVTQLLIDSTGSTLYSLTPSGVFKSCDSGSSWTAVGNLAGVDAIALDPASASTLYAGTAHGVVKTTDGGRTWNQAGLFNIGVTVLAIDPQTPSTLYASGNGNSISSAASIAFVTLDPLRPST